LDDFKRHRIDFRFEATAVPVGALDFVTTVIDLDALQPPTPLSRHGAYRRMRLSIADRNVAIVSCLSGCHSDDGERQDGQGAGFHSYFLSFRSDQLRSKLTGI
jgi:hypothetical protein